MKCFPSMSCCISCNTALPDPEPAAVGPAPAGVGPAPAGVGPALAGVGPFDGVAWFIGSIANNASALHVRSRNP